MVVAEMVVQEVLTLEAVAEVEIQTQLQLSDMVELVEAV
jgi:hypothetical protein